MFRRHYLIALVIALALLAVLAGCGAEEPKPRSVKPRPTPQVKKAPEKKPAPAETPTPTDTSAKRYAVIETSKGRIVFELYPDVAPKTVANFEKLAADSFYNGTKFHRVVPDFVVQGGDPNSKNSDPSDDGMGGPGYTVDAEFNKLKHTKGTVAMARSQDVNSAGSQFYICLAPQPSLDGKYTIFGQVTEGQEVVDKIQIGDVMTKVTVTETP